MILIEDSSDCKERKNNQEEEERQQTLKPLFEDAQSSSESTSPSVSPDKVACIRNQPLHTICESSEMSESHEYRSSPWINGGSEVIEKSTSNILERATRSKIAFRQAQLNLEENRRLSKAGSDVY